MISKFITLQMTEYFSNHFATSKAIKPLVIEELKEKQIKKRMI